MLSSLVDQIDKREAAGTWAISSQDALAWSTASAHARNLAACRLVDICTRCVVQKIRGAQITGSKSIAWAVERQRVWQLECT